MKNEIEVNRIFSNYNITPERYELMTYFVTKELSIYKNLSKLYIDKNFLLKRALELIKTINSSSNKNYNKVNDSLPNYSYRLNNTINTNLEKQIFINNFLFSNNEQFIHTLKMNNIKLKNIENLIDSINKQKIDSKKTNDYKLNIENICNINGICTYYNFNNKEIIINKILELYYLNNDLLKIKLSQKMR